MSDGSGYRVLVVDDDSSIRDAYRRILRPPPSEVGRLESLILGQAEGRDTDENFELIAAAGGEQAVALQRAALDRDMPPQVAFIDMRMPPGWDGLRTALALRAQDPSVYIVIATAFADYDVHELQRALGHDVVLLRKPFSQDEVYQLARTLCQSWETRRRLERLTAELDGRILARTAELEWRTREQQALVEIATRCVESRNEEEAEDAIHWSLASLGRLLVCDSCSLHQLDPSGGSLLLTHEWVAFGVSSLKASLNVVTLGDMLPLRARLKRGKIYAFGSLDELPEELAGLREPLRGHRQAGLLVPLERHDLVSGVLMVAYSRPTAPLSTQSEQLLRIAGHIISRGIETRQATRALQENKDQLERERSLLQAAESLSSVGGWQWDVTLHQMYWTPGCYALHDLDPGEVPNGSAALVERSLACYPPADRARILAAFRRCVEDGVPYDLESSFITAKGRRLRIRTTAIPRRRDGHVTELVGNLMDITAQSETLDRLRRIETIFSTSPDGMALLDRDYRYRIVNETYERYAARPASALIGLSVADYLGEDVFQHHVKARFDRCLAGETVQYEDWFDYPRLGRHFMSITYTPYVEANGEISGIVALSRDQSALRMLEAALRRSESSLQRLFDQVPDVAVQGYTADGTVRFWNRASEALYGYTREEALGRSLLDLIIPPPLRESVARAVTNAVTSGEPIPAGELVLMHKNGSPVPVYSSHIVVTEQGAEPLLYCLDQPPSSAGSSRG